MHANDGSALEGCWWAIDLWATPGSIEGAAKAVDNGCFGGQGTAEAVASGGRLKIWLEPADCCLDCEISITAQPHFKARAKVNPPGHAAAGGKISVTAPCGEAVAIGGVAVGYDEEHVQIPELPIPIPVTTGDPQQLKFSLTT